MYRDDTRQFIAEFNAHVAKKQTSIDAQIESNRKHYVSDEEYYKRIEERKNKGEV